jgi:transcriptional regulator with XRE-family HTH domain
VDTVRIGSVLRAVRIRQRLRQEDVAIRAGVSRGSVARAENGHIQTLKVRALVDIAGALGVRLDVEPRWRGGDLGRVLNAGHSAMHEQVAGMFAGQMGWLARDPRACGRCPFSQMLTGGALEGPVEEFGGFVTGE